MSRSLQPCDWYEHDVRGKYVIDVFGRTDKNQVACLRINGFRPYFYVRSTKKPTIGTVLAEKKYDVLAGFNNLQSIDVWKVVCDSKEMFSNATKSVEGTQYESNLPPFLRFFHDRDISPASPFRFKEHQYTIPTIPIVDEDEVPRPLYAVDVFYQCDLMEIESAPTVSIPLKVACYDLEMYSHSGLFPRANQDPIVQIGISYRWSNDMLTPVRRRVFVVGSVDASDDPSVEFVACPTEKEMLYKFAYEIRTQNPDIMCGYNTFGFDDAYIEDRCSALGITEDIDLARYQTKTKSKDGRWVMKFTETKKFELASGKYDLRFLSLRGRLGLDLLLNMRREHSLDSFKLDSVASVFLRDKVIDYKDGRVSTKSTRGLWVGNFVRFDVVGNTTDPYREGEKFRVTSIDPKGFTIDAPRDLLTDLGERDRKSLEWTLSKDDVEPAELFELHAHGGPAGRARIAKYCIQDCDLVLTLMAKLDTIVNARGMADVCKVPMEYVLRRGQGIKIFSAILYYASKRNQILRVQQALDDDSGYEGAIVISPKIGMYLEQPISVLDYNSLYPTNMISYNLSPDTLVAVRVMTAGGHLVQHECEGMTPAQMDELREQGWVIEEIEYDNKDDKDEIIGKTKCYYAQPKPNNELSIGVIPKTLDILLKKRKEFKEKMEDNQYDESQRAVYNGLQLAYKVVANSVYGQCGSRTSPIRKLCVAASTTAAGRKALYLAKHIVETEFRGEVVYGDTDSIFIKFPTSDLAESIRLGISAGKRITEQCRRPYKIAYEKTFYPFILFCRKRYVGMMYEEDANAKPKRKSMGIVLKRRDNAPIVKDVFGGALDILMQERDVRKAQRFVNQKLLDVLENRIPLEKFIISKSLRDDYITEVPESVRNHVSKGKPTDLNDKKASFYIIKKYAEEHGLQLPVSSIAHRVLADRMEARDAGTAPKVGDRIQFVYVAENKAKAKQGDRIEEIGYVRKNGLHPDSVLYITNQIQNPVAQLFALCIDQLEGHVPPRKPTYEQAYETYLEKFNGDEEDATLKLLDYKEKQLDSIMFLNSPVLSKIVRASVRGPMDAFIRRK